MANDWNLTEQLDQWRDLARVVREAGLSELTIEDGGTRLTFKAEVVLTPASPVSGSVPQVSAVAGTPLGSLAASGAASVATAAAPPPSNLIPISSPMVGTFYRAQSPDDPPFVAAGERVEIGQTVGLVEAMKTFNEITSEVEGIVAEVRVGDNELVETGSTLFLVKPS